MIAIIKLYEDKAEGAGFTQMLRNYHTHWEASLSAAVVEWVKERAYGYKKTWVLDGEDLIDFEDFYRAGYTDYPFQYNSAYRSQALTFEFVDGYGIRFFENDRGGN